MKENNKDCAYYLEQKKNVSNLVFNNEVSSLEVLSQEEINMLLAEIRKEE